MKLLPDDINEAVDLVIQLKPDALPASISNFGEEDRYYFDLKPVDPDFVLSTDQRIRLHPIDKKNLIVMDKVHVLATMMGYEVMKDKFQVVGTGFDTAGTIHSE